MSPTLDNRRDESANEDGDSSIRTLIRSYGLVQRLMQPHFLSFGITGAQWGVLRILDRAEKGGEKRLRVTEISARLLVQPPSVTAVVEKLVHDEYLSRSSNADDGRVRELSLTGKGKKLVGEVLANYPGILMSVLSGLSEVEERNLEQLLSKLNKHIEGLL